MRRTKEDAAKTRQSVIDAALRLFSTRGYSGTTFRAIAEEAGCSRGPIYWHFANKQELFEEILAYSQRPLEALVVSELDLNDPIATARAFAEEWLGLLISDRYFRQSFEIFLNKTEFTEEMASTIERERALTGSLVANFKKLVIAYREGSSSTTFATPAEVAAVSMYAYLMGLTQSWLFNPDILDLAEQKASVIARLEEMLKAA
jgi:TetR/AcrR family acrAB operon transcriptional repressor